MYEFTADDLDDLGEIGRGNFGSVNKMRHPKTNTEMAVKVSHDVVRTLTVGWRKNNYNIK